MSEPTTSTPELSTQSPVSRAPRKHVHVLGPRDARITEALDVTSRASGWGRALSPMVLGPVALYRDLTARTMENAWQYCKVYPQHVDANGAPAPAYWLWAAKGWTAPRADRYPMGKGVRPLYSLWDGERLGYLEARLRIYVPLYRAAVLASPAWAQLHAWYTATANPVLFDYDGFDRGTRTLDEVILDPSRPLGHGFVLALMLQAGDRWDACIAKLRRRLPRAA